MTTAKNTDFQRVKDLVAASSAATQKQIADSVAAVKKQVSDLAIQVAELREETKAELKGNIRDVRSELKALETKFDEKTKNLDQRIANKEFINRCVAVGMIATVVGDLLLAFGKLLFFAEI
jgi:flagellar motility protein MotE (MotC chaperone)